jgi:hypothetical protein
MPLSDTVGRFAQWISLQRSSLSDQTRSLSLSIVVDILADAEISPPAISLSRKRGESLNISRGMTIVVRGNASPLEPPCLIGAPEGVAVVGTSLVGSQGPEGEPAQRWQMELRIEYAGSKPDLFAAPMVKFGQSCGAKVLPISIRTAGLRCSPQTIYFLGVKIGVEHHRRFLIDSTDQSKFAIKSIAKSSSEVDTKCDLNKLSSKHWVDVFFKPTERRECTDQLLIDLDHQQTRQLGVRVVGVPGGD